jgi:hypothetical protein
MRNEIGGEYLSLCDSSITDSQVTRRFVKSRSYLLFFALAYIPFLLFVFVGGYLFGLIFSLWCVVLFLLHTHIVLLMIDYTMQQSQVDDLF